MMIYHNQKHLLFVCDGDKYDNNSTGIYIIHADGYVIKKFYVELSDPTYHFSVALKALNFLWKCCCIQDD